MKTKNIAVINAILALALMAAVVAGCASPPTTEMDNAREAVFRAENDSDAVMYGNNSLTRARDAIRRMETEAESKRYDTAKTAAAEAIAAAERAIADGRAGAARARDEAAAALANLPAEIEETGRNINGARYSQLDLDYAALEGDLKITSNLADQAARDQMQGKYQGAMDKARNVRANLADINQTIGGSVIRKK